MPAGKYFIESTDINYNTQGIIGFDGCSTLDSMVVNQPARLTPNVTVTNLRCFNDGKGFVDPNPKGRTPMGRTEGARGERNRQERERGAELRRGGGKGEHQEGRGRWEAGGEGETNGRRPLPERRSTAKR